MKKRFDSGRLYNENYFKLESYDGKINTIFHDNGVVPKEGSHCVCLSEFLVDFFSNVCNICNWTRT